MKAQPKMPRRPIDSPELKKQFGNSIMLLPTAQSQLGNIGDAFWEQLTNRLKNAGFDVYCNYNNLPYEKMVKGTISLSTTLTEIYELSFAFKKFIGFRSGILDLLAMGGANMVILHSQSKEVDHMELMYGDPVMNLISQLPGTENINSYQYRLEWEDELIDTIMKTL